MTDVEFGRDANIFDGSQSWATDDSPSAKRNPKREAVGPGRQSGLLCSWADTGPVIRPFTTSQRFQLVLKRALDVALATVALLLLGVFLVLIAATIKATSPGPILFRQRRVGLNGEIFEIFKFRTMHFSQEDLTGVRQTSLADERVTPIGKVLRRASVDELPQLINVLRGEMSLVGPRPHVLGMLAAGTPYEQLVPYYTVRQIVRPGVTGWAQAHGLRGPTDDAAAAKARVDHDIAYIQNFGVWLDVRTIFYTIAVELRRGAGV